MPRPIFFMNNIVAIDLETSGLRWSDEIYLIGVAWWEHGKICTKSYVFNIETLLWGNPQSFPEIYHDFIKIIKGKDLVFHNGSFDIPLLVRDGFFSFSDVWGKVHDTLLLARMVGSFEHVGLEYLVDLFELDKELIKYKSSQVDKLLKGFNWKESKKQRSNMQDFIMQNLPDARKYVEVDSAVTLLLYKKLISLYDRYYRDRELEKMSGDLSILSAKMRYDGIALNTERIKEERVIAEERLNQVKRFLLKRGICSPNNRTDLVLFLKKNNIQILTSEKGNPILDDTNLNDLLGKTDEVDKVIQYVLEGRHLEKYISTYYTGFLDELFEDNRVHPLFRAGGTVSGRFSCQFPSVHTVARDLKSWFFAPGSDSPALIKMDFAQAEVRLGSIYARSNKMAEMIDSGIDMHLETACLVWGRDFILSLPKEKRKQYRYIAKQGRFSSQYGAGPNKLMEVLGNITLEEATTFLENYRRAFPELHSVMRKASRVWEERGYLKLWDGTLLWMTPRYFERSYAAFNQLIQPGIARIMVHGMLQLERSDLPVRIVNQVHDEVVFEILAPRKDVIDIVNASKEIMESILPERLSHYTNPPIYMKTDPEIIWRQ